MKTVEKRRSIFGIMDLQEDEVTLFDEQVSMPVIVDISKKEYQALEGCNRIKGTIESKDEYRTWNIKGFIKVK